MSSRYDIKTTRNYFLVIGHQSFVSMATQHKYGSSAKNMSVCDYICPHVLAFILSWWRLFDEWNQPALVRVFLIHNTGAWEILYTYFAAAWRECNIFYNIRTALYNKMLLPDFNWWDLPHHSSYRILRVLCVLFSSWYFCDRK